MRVTTKISNRITLYNKGKDLIDWCIKENTFVNPLYISNEQANRSNWDTPREITTYSYDEHGNLVLPRGFLEDLRSYVDRSIDFIDPSYSHVDIPLEYPKSLIHVKFRPYQEIAIEAAVWCSQGVVVSPTGSGKSIMGLEIIRKKGQKALILVHRGELAKQWLEVIEARMGLKAGFIGDGKWEIGEHITVAMIQTLATNQQEDIYDAFGLILLDEAHHVPASTFFDVIGRFKAKFCYGLSATPQRRDGLEKLIYLGIGPKIAEIDRAEVEKFGATVPVDVRRVKTHFNPGIVDSWQDYVSALCEAPYRNELIIKIADNSTSPVLILVDRTAHADQLSEMMAIKGIDHILAHGKLGKKELHGIMERVKNSKITVGTCSLLGEGLDISAWGTLIMGAPISSEIKLLQAIGRVVRPSEGKERAIVYDLVDDCFFSGGSFNKRFEIYKKHDIWVEF